MQQCDYKVFDRSIVSLTITSGIRVMPQMGSWTKDGEVMFSREKNMLFS
jgi:hypothetical protein